jgi:pilus assembly protein CpaF
MFPERPSGPAAARPSGATLNAPADAFEALKGRLVCRLEERMSPAASKRIPSSILRQGLRAYAEHVVELEARHLSAPDRERLVDEGLAELLGYRPLAELFRDPSVREVLVSGATTVLVRRDTAGWVPTSARFANEEHLRESLDRLATHADPVGPVTASVNLFDVKLPNGFRAVAVIPPEAVGRTTPCVAFVRMEVNATPLPAESPLTASGRVLNASSTRSGGANAPPAPAGGTPAAPPPVRPAPASTPARQSSSESRAAPASSGRSAGVSRMTPPSRPSPLEFTPSRDRLTVYRKLITERLFTKLAQQGLYDPAHVETEKLRAIVSSFIAEYSERERLNVSDEDKSRLLREILKALGR